MEMKRSYHHRPCIGAMCGMQEIVVFRNKDPTEPQAILARRPKRRQPPVIDDQDTETKKGPSPIREDP